MSTTIVGMGLGIALLVAFAYWNGRPVSRTPDEIAQLLRARLRGEEDPGQWDYFVSCRVRDDRLEAVRIKWLSVEIEGSKYLSSDSQNMLELSELGVKRLGELVAECEAISPSSTGA